MLCEPSQPEKTLFYTSVISQLELVWNGDKRWFSYWSSINDINTQEFSLKNRFILTPMIIHFLLETLSSVYVGWLKDFFCLTFKGYQLNNISISLITVSFPQILLWIYSNNFK